MCLPLKNLFVLFIFKLPWLPELHDLIVVATLPVQIIIQGHFDLCSQIILTDSFPWRFLLVPATVFVKSVLCSGPRSPHSKSIVNGTSSQGLSVVI